MDLQQKKILLQFHKKYYIILNLIKTLIKNYYNNPKYNYPKIAKTFKLINKYYIIKKLRKHIVNYINLCFFCN